MTRFQKLLACATGICLLVVGAQLLLDPDFNIGPKTRTPTATDVAPNAPSDAVTPVIASRESVSPFRDTPPAVDVPKEQITYGSVEGRLLTTDGQPVALGSIRLESASAKLAFEPTETAVRPDGGFSYFGLQPGAYLAQVVAGSLGEKFVRPWQSSVQSPEQTITVRAGETTSIDLTVFRPGCITGRVVDSQGIGIASVIVRFQSTIPGYENLAPETVTEPDGQFRLAQMRPGWYRTQIYLPSAVSSDLVNAPPPLDFEVREEDNLNLGDIVVGPGPHVVRGTVVDRDGRAFSGLEVLAYLNRPVPIGVKPHNWSSRLGTAVTDSRGEFTLAGLPSEQIAIQIAPQGYLPNNSIGQNLVARPVQQVLLDLQREPHEVVLETIRATASRPYQFAGQLVGEVTDSKGRNVKLRTLQLSVVLSDPASADEFDRARFPATLRPEKDGSFSWWCETPTPPVTILVSLPGRSEPIATRRLFPSANAREVGEIALQ